MVAQTNAGARARTPAHTGARVRRGVVVAAVTATYDSKGRTEAIPRYEPKGPAWLGDRPRA